MIKEVNVKKSLISSRILEKKEPSWLMLVPMVLLTALAVILGIFPDIILDSVRILSELLL